MGTTYRLQGFGDTDPSQILTGAISQAQQRLSTSGWIMGGILVAVALIVWRHK